MGMFGLIWEQSGITRFLVAEELEKLTTMEIYTYT